MRYTQFELPHLACADSGQDALSCDSLDDLDHRLGLVACIAIRVLLRGTDGTSRR